MDGEAEFSVTPVIRGNCRVLVLEGELDMSGAPSLSEALDACTDGLPVVVDLTVLRFLDSGGIHVLLGERIEARPYALVRAPGSNVERVLDIIRAEKSVPMYDDLPAALEALGTRS